MKKYCNCNDPREQILSRYVRSFLADQERTYNIFTPVCPVCSMYPWFLKPNQEGDRWMSALREMNE